MQGDLGTPAHPLRVAIIGSGPSGFYAAEHLQEQDGLEVQIDMYDRLPTPFGLVRGGVAPDHQKIKSVTRVYDKIAAHPEFRFYGNVEMGRDLTHADLTAYYHAIVYAVGARTDRRMGIPREHLPGSHSATEFVGWYNAHPDFRSLGFDLASESAAVVGNGNVAMDLARILASPREVLVLAPTFNRKGYHPPRVAKPGQCVNCNLCEMLCPEFAIFSFAVAAPAQTYVRTQEAAR